MRIIENSPSRLKLRETTGYLPAFLAAAALIVAAIVILKHLDPRQLVNAALFAVAAVFFRRDSRITLNKAMRTCEIWRQDMWRRSVRTIMFDDITDVEVEIQEPDTDALVHARLSLSTLDGPIPLTAGFRADLDGQIALRETMVDAIFAGRPRPAPLDPAKLLLDAGRPFAAARRG